MKDEEDIEDIDTDTEPDIKDDDMGLKDNDLFNDSFGDFGLGEEGRSAMEKHSELLKELTDFDPQLKETINNWLGIVWDEEKKKYVPNPYVEPIMNMKCAVWCIGFLKTYAKKTNIITDISRQDYDDFQMDIIDVVYLDLGVREDFGIKSDDLRRISTELFHTALLVLMGAGDGKYNKLLKESVQRTENIQMTDRPPAQAMGKTKGMGMIGNLKNKLLGR